MNYRIFIVLLYTIFIPFNLFSSSFVIKFKSIESKIKFLPIIEKSLNCTADKLPIVSSIENILKNKEIGLAHNSKNMLTEFLTYSIINFKNPKALDNLSMNLQRYDIEYFEPNLKITLNEIEIKDEKFKEQWYIDAINTKAAWKFAKGKNIRIGVIDTGLDLNNIEFQDRIWVNPKEDINRNGTFEPWSDTLAINGLTGDLNGIDDDGNGFVDDVIGYDFVNQILGNLGDYIDPDPIPEDEHGHGTLVSGIICAGINNTGIVGIAPNANLVVLRAFDVTGNAEVKDIASAIIYAGLNKIDVLNLSFGTNYNSRLLREAIKFAAEMGCIIIASSGNDGEIVEHYPSDYPEVISVGATTGLGQIGKSSNFGPRVDIFAPGYEILTTTIGNNYKYVSGTSFSAAIVSGVVALLLEINPNLTPNEIKAILKSTQTPLKDKRSFNQGIVNAGDAVTFLGTSKVEITHPYEMQEFDKQSVSRINAIYSIFSPLFESYQLSLFINDTSLVANLLTEQKVQRLNDTFGIDVSDLINGTYTLLLKIRLKTGSYFVTTRKFVVFSSDSNIVLDENNVIKTIFETKSVPIYFSKSNLPTFCTVSAYINDRIVKIYTDNLYGNYHFIPIEFQSVSFNNEQIILKVEHRTNSGLIRNDTLIVDNLYQIKQKSVIEKFQKLPLSYIFNKSINLQQFSGKGILINPYKNLEWSNLEFYLFEDSLFKKIASYPKAFIPVDIGNTNGDNFDEILTTSFGRTIIFEPKKLDDFFGNIVFESKSDEILWGAKFFDIDNDGRDEFFGYNNNSILVYKILNDRLNLIHKITPSDTFGLVGTRPNIQIADFDGDGFFELAFFTTNGYLVVYQLNLKDSLFNLEFSTKIEVDPFSISSCVSTFHGFDKKTLCFVACSNVFSDNFTYEYSVIWKLYSLRCSASNTYEIKEEMNFWGARFGATPQGIFYRNGIANGNVNNQIGDEIILSLFPNLYVLSYKQQFDSFYPIFWLPYVYSNSIIVEDFDNNGINEFGVSRWDGLYFYEFSSENILDVPTNVDGWVEADDKIFLKWDKVVNANSYQVFELDKTEDKLILLGQTNEANFLQKRSFVQGERIFFIRAIDTTGVYLPSDFSNPIVVIETTLTIPLAVYVLNENQILVAFSGKIGNKFLPYKETSLFNELGDKINIGTVSRANDTSLIISIFDKLREGKYLLAIDSFRDGWGNYTISKVLEFTYEIKNETDSLLIFEQFFFVDRFNLEIHFPIPLDYYSASSVSNYTVKPFGAIDEVQIEKNVAKIKLSKEPNIYSLGRDFYLVLGKIYSTDSARYVQPPYNTVLLTRQAFDIDNSFAYPNPLSLNQASEITFANIPNGSRIEIFDQNFIKILEIDNNGWRGGVSIDLLQTNRNFSPGIYYFRVGREVNGSWFFSSLKKFAIIK